jgi:hypothetical protein
MKTAKLYKEIADNTTKTELFFADQDMRRPALREDEEMDLSSQLRLLLTKLPKLTALHLRG